MQGGGIRSEDERSEKNGRGVNPCAKMERPAHGTMSQGLVMVMANSTVVSTSALTLSLTL